MPLAARVVMPCVIGVAVLAMLPGVRAEQPQPQVDQFNGTWDYYPDESINVATGRPEQAPASARRTVPRGGGVPDPTNGGRPGGGTIGAGGTGLPGAGPGGGGGLGRGPGDAGQGFGDNVQFRDFLMVELRGLARDLLEVPESLRFEVTPSAVTITDDLGRALVLPTDAGAEQKLQKYQLSASKFEARAIWTGPVLRKEISGVRGFRMTETYSLSQDGRRLFVIVRVGEDKPNVRPVGANRVYDRVESSAPESSVAAGRIR